MDIPLARIKSQSIHGKKAFASQSLAGIKEFLYLSSSLYGMTVGSPGHFFAYVSYPGISLMLNRFLIRGLSYSIEADIVHKTYLETGKPNRSSQLKKHRCQDFRLLLTPQLFLHQLLLLTYICRFKSAANLPRISVYAKAASGKVAGYAIPSSGDWRRLYRLL